MSSNDSSFYFYFLMLPLLLPLILGVMVLSLFWKNKLIRLIGFFTLKPVLAYPFWFLISATVANYWYGNWFDNFKQSLGNLFPLMPAIILSIGIVYAFRNLFAHRIAQLFLCLDILRMLNTFILVSSNSNMYFYLLLWFGLLLPSFIAILALSLAIIQNKSVSSA